MDHKYTDIPDGDYFAIDAVNQSLLKQVLRSPAHARTYLENPPEPTAAMRLGTAVHLAVLEPDQFKRGVVIEPTINRRTKEGRLQYQAFLKQATGKTVITKEQAATCVQVGHAVTRHQSAMSLLNSGDKELAYRWEDPATGLMCKAKCDVSGGEEKIVVDLKTTRDASTTEFPRSCAKFLYHLQAAFYLRGVSGLPTGVDAYKDGWRFYIVAVETSAPHSTAVYKLDARSIIEGDKLVDRSMRAWAEAKLLGVFPGYDDEVVSLGLPAWALTEHEEENIDA